MPLYMDVHHPDIVEFLNIRIPTGDVQRKALNIHNAINITDEFMEAVVNDEEFALRDPKNNEVKETINARKLWERILEVRFRTGEPYLNFIDTANKHLPENLKELGLKIHGSNLCNEIHLPTSDDRTAVCCLSSLNLEYYDEWKDTTIVRDIIRMLDNVLQYFIDNAPDTIERAKYSASRERSPWSGSNGIPLPVTKTWSRMGIRISKRNQQSHLRTYQLRSSCRNRTPWRPSEENIPMEWELEEEMHLLAIAPNAKFRRNTINESIY